MEEEHRSLEVSLPIELRGPEEDVRQTVDLGHCLVTGAAGFLGRHLVAELLERGCAVRGFDRQQTALSHPGFEFVRGDTCALEDLEKACEGIDTVFHTAAVLDFGRHVSCERRERSHAVNVQGVENLVRAAEVAGVRRLIQTSSNNVTFDGPVIDGDETWPYASRARDLYTETKVAGERAALAASGRGRLLTCSIRPGGIYGPGEVLVVPRLVKELLEGRYVATIGDGSALSDNTYIDNLVDGQIEAARHLVPGSALPGQAYFVTDGHPINYFEFFRPIVEGLGYRQPRLRVPAGAMLRVAQAWEFLHHKAGFPAPLLLPLEIRKIVISHYNRIDKARRDFGWTPKVSPEEAMEDVLAYARRLVTDAEVVDRPHWGWWVAILGGMSLLGVLTLSPGAHATWEGWVGPWTPRWLLAGTFVWALLLHVYKGMKAVRLAEQAGLSRSSMGWGWQTFALGFASLRLLQRQIAERESTAPAPR